MRELSLIILFIIASFFIPDNKSPHGDKLNISCSECHTSDGWTVDVNNISFKHEQTGFRLEGAHSEMGCKQCHTTLVFSEAQSSCISCHEDIHEQTVGFDCQRCHNTTDWIVTDIVEVHENSRFPLLGAHLTADCYSCHKTEKLLRFDPIGVNCVDCHLDDYQATTKPNHIESGYSTNCEDCHGMNAFAWTGSNFTHTFFPLVDGHALNDCAKCHTDPNDYGNIDNACVSCHQDDFNNAQTVDHVGLGFSTECNLCHTLAPGWSPAKFEDHDPEYFPIYSGKHSGTWNTCTDCHNQPDNYQVFTCIDCHDHNKSKMDDKHLGEVSGYVYESNACLECHPSGSGEGSFNHAQSNFPLTGAHVDVDCAGCHANGYIGTPTTCSACHLEDFNQTTNPNHVDLGLDNTCDDCHTTDPGWKPAEFAIHDQYYQLTGAHALNTVDCASCHNGDYQNTPNECVGCHLDDYNNSTNPSHTELNFAQTCEDCHTTNPGWSPTTFNHDDYYVLNGAHADISNDCNSCHNGDYQNTPNQCVGCHLDDFNQTSNPNHTDAGFSQTCDECHTTNPGWSPATFVNHNDYWVISGAHINIASDCNACHNGDYNNTPTECVGCHLEDYNATTDPPHQTAQFPTDCLACHTDNAWSPSTFDHDGDYFPIYSGKHNNEWNQCSECHTVASDYSIFSCIDCHEHNKPEMDSKHSEVSGYVYESNACLDCHPDGSSGDGGKSLHAPNKVKIF